MTSEPEITPVLAEYPQECEPSRWQFLAGAGGFSGSLLWLLTTPAGPLCLRRWPRTESPPRFERQRLKAIHRFLKFVHAAGFDRVPLPRQARSGHTVIEHAAHFWDLSTWMPGRADFGANPSEVRLCAAMTALGEFHCAAESFPAQSRRRGRSDGMRRRYHELCKLMHNELAPLRRCIEPADWPEMAERSTAYYDLAWQLAPRLVGELTSTANLQVPLQVCLRDVWHENMLYEGDRVTAILDFSTLAVDNVATDVARLLGSCVLDDPAGWRAGLEAYESIRPLSADERRLVAAFDRANVILSGLNWIRWVYQDRREFDDRPRVLARMDHWLTRIRCLLARSASEG